MKCKERKLVCIIFIIMSLMMGLTPWTAAAQDAPQTQVRIYWAEHLAGENRVAYPVVSGMANTDIQNAINQEIFMSLHAGDMLARLERIRQRPESEQKERTLYMDGAATLAGDLLSIVVRTQGEQYDGSRGDSAVCLNYHLGTGEQVTLDRLMHDPNAARERMTALVEEQIIPELNAYLSNSDLLPLPEDAFFLDEQGLTFYYPQERFSMISGHVGACSFYYYELGDALDRDGELLAPLFAAQPMQEDAAAAIEEAVKNGAFPHLPFKLGEKVGMYLEEYPLINDPDYTLTSLVYQFEDPALRGVGVETWVYDEAAEEERAVTAVRAARADFYGIQAGVSTLESCRALLGEPDITLGYDADEAMDMLLMPGESIIYTFGSNELEIHADEQGIVSCMIIRAGAA